MYPENRGMRFLQNTGMYHPGLYEVSSFKAINLLFIAMRTSNFK
jgi:hypothetical protein